MESVSFVYDDDELVLDYKGMPVLKVSGGPVISTLAITKANIIYKDILTVGILNAGKSADFAASYYDDNEDGKPDVDKIIALDGVQGFTVAYSNINGVFGLEGNSKYEDFALLSYATVSGIALAESVTANAAAATKVAPEVGVSSDAVINGATVSLTWKGADFVENAVKKGAISAQVKIAL